MVMAGGEQVTSPEQDQAAVGDFLRGEAERQAFRSRGHSCHTADAAPGNARAERMKDAHERTHLHDAH